MKHKFLIKVTALCLVSSSVIAAMPYKASAAWISNYNGGWAYSDGYTLVTGWKYLNGAWYYFDSMGRMQTGWLNDGGNLYYLDGNGAMQNGVIQIEGKIYLFADSGEMQQGFAIVNGKAYNFADNGACIGTDMPVPKKAYDYYGESTLAFTPNQIMNSSAEISNEIPWDGNEKVTKYKITYKDDDGEVLSRRSINADEKITLYKPSKAGYKFVEWNTKEDGDGTSYQEDERIKLTKDMTLYAQWDEIEEKNDNVEEKTEVTGIRIKIAGVNDNESATISYSYGKKVQMSAIITPGDATNRKVNWSVKSATDDEKATIASNGMLTIKEVGTITVIATATDGSGVVGKRQILIQ